MFSGIITSTASSGVASATGVVKLLPPDYRNVVVAQESRDIHASEEDRCVSAIPYADTTIFARSENRVMYAESEDRGVEVEPDMATSLYVVAESRCLVVEYEERNVIAEERDV